jgi:PAS domain S-box-containing protein
VGLGSTDKLPQPSAPAEPAGNAAEPAACNFLRGGGTMGAHIRAFDWARSPLGPADSWPQSLRTVVRLMLNSNHPVFIYWGSELICLYNDAFSHSLGPERHPSILGQRGAVAWDEIWPIIGHQIETVMHGQGAYWSENELVPITRHGRREDVYWTYSYSPIDDDDAATGVGGVLVLCNETTRQVLADARQTFLIEIADRLLTTADPRNAIIAVGDALGKYLGLDGVGFANYDAAWDVAEVDEVWRKPGLPGLGGRYSIAAFGSAIVEQLRKGETVVIEDVATSPLVRGDAVANFAMIDTRAMIQVPLDRSGCVAVGLFVMSELPRTWTANEVQLIEEVGMRTAAAVERARGERAVRDSEALLRAIGESSAELIFAKDREHRLIYANPATLKAIGRSRDEAIGRTEREWYADPAEAEAIIATDNQVMQSGKVQRFEQQFTPPGGNKRIYESTKAAMRDHGGDVIGVVGVSTDITERHRDQAHLNLLVAELNHRVKNTLAIVQSLAHKTFRGAGIEATARTAFDGRLAALATAHNLLTRERWEATDLETVVVETLAAQVNDPTSVSIRGPSVRLDPKTAVSIAMALHELATNAIKYGALSVDGGHVTVRWSSGSADEPRLLLDWRESGGPKVTAPTTRGFGSRMIERALASELRGKVTLKFLADGLHCAIDAPLPTVVPVALQRPKD